MLFNALLSCRNSDREIALVHNKRYWKLCNYLHSVSCACVWVALFLGSRLAAHRHGTSNSNVWYLDILMFMCFFLFTEWIVTATLNTLNSERLKFVRILS